MVNGTTKNKGITSLPGSMIGGASYYTVRLGTYGDPSFTGNMKYFALQFGYDIETGNT